MPRAITTGELALFQCLLIGTWKNDEKLTSTAGPLSYNVMPLPQMDPQTGHRTRHQIRRLHPEELQPSRKRSASTAAPRTMILPNIGIPRRWRSSPARRTAAGTTRSSPTPCSTISRSGSPKGRGRRARFVHVENGAWLHLGSGKQRWVPTTSARPIATGRCSPSRPTSPSPSRSRCRMAIRCWRSAASISTTGTSASISNARA